jgi:hypothetical protein
MIHSVANLIAICPPANHEFLYFLRDHGGFHGHFVVEMLGTG